MNTNWSKILLFGLLFGVAGFVLGRLCGSCHQGGCGPRGGHAECHQEAGKADCCKGGHHAAGPGGDTIRVVSPATSDTVLMVSPSAH